MIAEAKPEQKAAEQSELDEVPLVMEPVLETVEVKRLRDDARHALARDIRAQRADIGARIRVGRTEIGEVRVPEGVAARAVGICCAKRVVVQEHGPRTHAQGAGGRLAAEVGERIRASCKRADLGLQRQPTVPACVRLEEHAVALEEMHLARGVVREDVAALVIGGRHGDAAQARAIGGVVQHVRHPLVGEVAGEGEYGRVDGQDVSAASVSRRARR